MIRLSEPEIITALIVVFGSIVHATAQLKIHRDKNMEFTVGDFAILTVLAGFSGLMTGITASIYFDSQAVIYLMSGVGSFLGIAGFNIIANTAMEVLVVKFKK